MKRAITLIPTHKPDLTPLERISVTQTLKVLKDQPVALMVPEGLELGYLEALWKEAGKELQVEWFGPEYFQSVVGFQRLLLSRDFYQRFQDEYEFLLLCQTDVFLFEDQLEKWCAKPWDYWGAPWMEDRAQAGAEARLTGVGCGGFSLRRIEPHVRVLSSFGYVRRPSELVERLWTSKRGFRNKLHGAKQLLKQLTIGNNFHHWFNNFIENEDVFWGDYARRSFDWFRVPPPEEALGFCMEVQPARMLEMNGGELPFAVHAWWTYDLEFWRPYVEKAGYELGEEAVAAS